MGRAQRPAPAAAQEASARVAADAMSAAARVVAYGALALLALRVLAVFAPGRWLWGVDLGRDLPTSLFVWPLLGTLLLFVPAVGRATAGVLPRRPRAFALLAAGLALMLAGFVWSFPDRALYTGDAGMRHGAFAAVVDPAPLAEQALAGDLLLHHALPRWVARHTACSAEQAGRAQGALLALLTALAGWRLARALGANGALGFAVLAVAGCTGALALDNGYGKASVEVACLTSIAAIGVARSARDGGGLASTGLAVGAALLLHRSALALLPAWLCVAMLAVRSANWRRPSAIAGLVAPVVSLAIVGPRLLQVIGTFDVRHHTAAGSTAATLAAALASAHLLDVLHTLALLVPLAPLVPLLMLLPPRPERREALAYSAFVLPPLLLLLIVRPQQGLARDWDVFAFTGSAVAAATAWRFSRVLAAPSARWLAVPLALVSLVPVLQWTALQSDAERAWSRAESILLGPPAREPSERADALGTIGMLRFARGQYGAARRLFQRSAEDAPNPRMFMQWGMAETMLGRPAEAMVQYRHAATLNPGLTPAWRGIAAAASALGDRASMVEAVGRLAVLEPGGETLHDARAWLVANPPR